MTNLGLVSGVCVVGSVNMDMTLGVDALPRPGETVLAASLTYAPGGKGANQAGAGDCAPDADAINAAT